MQIIKIRKDSENGQFKSGSDGDGKRKQVQQIFKIKERNSNVKTEIIAGLTTFFAMAYIVVTNPNQITGFSTDGDFGMIWNAVYVASILAAIVGTMLYALYARLP